MCGIGSMTNFLHMFAMLSDARVPTIMESHGRSWKKNCHGKSWFVRVATLEL